MPGRVFYLRVLNVQKFQYWVVQQQKLPLLFCPKAFPSRTQHQPYYYYSKSEPLLQQVE